MFTGLVEEVGTVQAVKPQGDALRLTVGAELVADGTQNGDSIAVNGVCLTVAELDTAEGTFTADVMRESIERTALAELHEGSPVNLERALLPTTRMGGHLVQGHVDATATLLSRTPSEHWDVLRFSLPAKLSRYVVEKGSIAVSGTSLTVSAIDEGPVGEEPVGEKSAGQVSVGEGANEAGYFEVSLIPTTLSHTILGTLEVGQKVNLEVDIVAKYVEKLLSPGR